MNILSSVHHTQSYWANLCNNGGGLNIISLNNVMWLSHELRFLK